MSEKKTAIVTEVSHGVFNEVRQAAYAVLRHVIAVGVLLFYSKNVIAAAFRAFVGA